MRLFSLPVLPAGATPKQAFELMARENVSATIYHADGRSYLLEAGTAFVYWKVYANYWSPEHVGTLLNQHDAAPGAEQMGRLQIQSLQGLSATIFSKRETFTLRYTVGPASCYCTSCEEPSVAPGVCHICKQDTVICAP